MLLLNLNVALANFLLKAGCFIPFDPTIHKLSVGQPVAIKTLEHDSACFYEFSGKQGDLLVFGTFQTINPEHVSILDPNIAPAVEQMLNNPKLLKEMLEKIS